MCIAKVKGVVFILVSIESFEVVDRRRKDCSEMGEFME